MTQIAIHRPRKTAKRSGLSLITRAFSIRRQRRHLARLDDRALKDIGITRAEVEAELRRPVWDAPQFWQK